MFFLCATGQVSGKHNWYNILWNNKNNTLIMYDERRDMHREVCAGHISSTDRELVEILCPTAETY